MKTERIKQSLRNILLPNQAAPQIGRVLKAYKGPGKNTYAVDVRIVTAGTLEDTDMEIAEVPINPIWIGKKGKGIYAIPPPDALVIVGFIGWNVAFPYIAGMYSDEYAAGEFADGQLMITDGEGVKFGVDVDALFFFETKQKSLKEILEKLIDEIAAIQTQGAPPQHVVSPASVQKLQLIKLDIAQLLK